MPDIFKRSSSDTKQKRLELALCEGVAMQNSVLDASLLGTIPYVKLLPKLGIANDLF